MKKQSMSKTDWKYAYIYIYSNDLMKKTKPNWAMNTYFVFWVEHGIGYRTDVAFDDVQLVPRSCRGLTFTFLSAIIFYFKIYRQ